MKLPIERILNLLLLVVVKAPSLISLTISENLETFYAVNLKSMSFPKIVEQRTKENYKITIKL